jgi:hypothetical protein
MVTAPGGGKLGIADSVGRFTLGLEAFTADKGGDGELFVIMIISPSLDWYFNMRFRYNSIITVTQLFIWYYSILNHNQIHIVTELLLIESLLRQVLLSFLNPLFLLILVLLLDHGGGDAGSRSSAAPKSTVTAAATDSCAIVAARHSCAAAVLTSRAADDAGDHAITPRAARH